MIKKSDKLHRAIVLIPTLSSSIYRKWYISYHLFMFESLIDC
jgi:hypothetical protein